MCDTHAAASYSTSCRPPSRTECAPTRSPRRPTNRIVKLCALHHLPARHALPWPRSARAQRRAARARARPPTSVIANRRYRHVELRRRAARDWSTRRTRRNAGSLAQRVQRSRCTANEIAWQTTAACRTAPTPGTSASGTVARAPSSVPQCARRRTAPTRPASTQIIGGSMSAILRP